IAAGVLLGGDLAGLLVPGPVRCAVLLLIGVVLPLATGQPLRMDILLGLLGLLGLLRRLDGRPALLVEPGTVVGA
ncbi:hypothetical protein AN219_27190, partial [Streptomyces nanshensis]